MPVSKFACKYRASVFSLISKNALVLDVGELIGPRVEPVIALFAIIAALIVASTAFGSEATISGLTIRKSGTYSARPSASLKLSGPATSMFANRSPVGLSANSRRPTFARTWSLRLVVSL